MKRQRLLNDFNPGRHRLAISGAVDNAEFAAIEFLAARQVCYNSRSRPAPRKT